MKKAITLIPILIIVFSLTSTAQSKEETIDWIKSKLILPSIAKPILSNVRQEISDFQVRELNECYLKVSYISVWSNGNPKMYIETIPIKGLSQDYERRYRINYNGIKTEDPDGKITVFHATGFVINNVEPNLNDRILKALNHLSTSCETKEETF